MAVNTKIIKRRIGSISNTKKITKAMELVSASKMRKAVGAVLSTRPYARAAWDVVGELAGEGERPHPLVRKRDEVNRTLFLLLTSHRGLCGGFNAQMLKLAREETDRRGSERADIAAVGRRGEAWASRRGMPVIASFPGLLENPSALTVRPLAKMATDGFLDGTWDEVVLLYTDYVSAVSQKPRAKVLLPLSRDDMLGEAGPSEPKVKSQMPNVRSEPQSGAEYLFEPDRRTVLDRLLPRIVESQILQAVLESSASEHSARMMAMRNASDNASEMLENLRFTFNQARQAGITQEIAEISAGRAALE